MRTTVDLPDRLSRSLKSEAALRGLKMKDLLQQFITEGLQKETKTAQKKKSLRGLPLLPKKNQVPMKSLTNAEIQGHFDKESDGH